MQELFLMVNYVQDQKKGDINRILETLVYHGADRGILIEAHPHIGTDKLPKIIKKIEKQFLIVEVKFTLTQELVIS